MESRRIQLQERIQRINASFPNVPTVTPRQVHELAKPVVFVDCRSAEERRVSMIRPDAITEGEFERQCLDICSQGATVVAYCTIGYRSAQFVAKHKRSDISMYNLSGSLLAWIHDGYEIWGDKDTGYDHVTHEIHVWGKEYASYVGKDYTPVYFQHPLLQTLFSKVLGR